MSIVTWEINWRHVDSRRKVAAEKSCMSRQANYESTSNELSRHILPWRRPSWVRPSSRFRSCWLPLKERLKCFVLCCCCEFLQHSRLILKGVRGRRHYLVEFSLKGGSETSCWGRDSFFGLQALIKNEGWILARYRRSFQYCVFSHWGSFPLFAFVALLSCSFVCSFLHPFLSSTHEKRDSIQKLPFFTKNRDFTHNVKNLGQR